MGSFLRANTCITQMLSAYARRGHGLTILKNTLAAPLQHICAQKELNLEIDPLKVLSQYQAEYETQHGKKCALPACETGQAAMQVPEVAVIVQTRLQQLLEICETLLHRIIDGVDSVPYVKGWGGVGGSGCFLSDGAEVDEGLRFLTLSS